MKMAFRLFAAYWLITVVVGMLLPEGQSLETIRDAVHVVLNPLGGVMQVTSKSFDPAFVEVFCAVSFSTAVALILASCFTVPAGSASGAFLGVRKKVGTVLLTALMFGAFLILPFMTQNTIDLDGSRSSAFLYLGASSKLGTLTILNSFYGFGQLFFWLALRAAFTTPVLNPQA